MLAAFDSLTPDQMALILEAICGLLAVAYVFRELIRFVRSSDSNQGDD